VPRELLDYFPIEEGHTWIYHGFAEYGHRMKLDRILREKGQIIYQISGELEDPSGGEAPGPFDFSLEYLFTDQSLFETVDSQARGFPHKIQRLEMLRLPLTRGATWTQKVKVNDHDSLMTATVEEQNINLVKVSYQAPDPNSPEGMYRETRTFERGKGLAFFTNTIAPDVTEFNYQLYEP
jgi:hypothetical protein